jgi:hypothetical protein
MQQALIYANYAMVWLETFKQVAIRLTYFVRDEILSKPVYVFLKGCYVPVKLNDLLPFSPENVDWYYDSAENHFYKSTSLKRERSTILSAELISDRYRDELTTFFENAYWSGDKEPSQLHYVSAWAVMRGKRIPFDGTYSLKMVTNGCEEITKVLAD